MAKATVGIGMKATNGLVDAKATVDGEETRDALGLRPKWLNGRALGCIQVGSSHLRAQAHLRHRSLDQVRQDAQRIGGHGQGGCTWR
jgi:hypothetical protein